MQDTQTQDTFTDLDDNMQPQPKTNEEIIEENAMKLTRDWDSFKQTKLHLQYMLTEARRSAIRGDSEAERAKDLIIEREIGSHDQGYVKAQYRSDSPARKDDLMTTQRKDLILTKDTVIDGDLIAANITGKDGARYNLTIRGNIDARYINATTSTPTTSTPTKSRPRHRRLRHQRPRHRRSTSTPRHNALH